MTLQSYRHMQLLDSRSFQLVPLQSSFLKVEVSSTSALLSWTGWSKGQALWICVDQQCWVFSSFRPSRLVTGLQPGTYYGVTVRKTTQIPHLNITITQKLQLAIKTGECPMGWMAVGWSCFQVKAGGGLAWAEAQQACGKTAPGVHLANLKTDAEFLSVSSHLQNYNHLLLLWTALNDRQEEGDLRWSDESTYNLSVDVMSSLSANQTDCFALQKNATGPGYFLTSLLCYLRLPYMCQTDLLQGSFFGLQLESVCETEVVFRWLNLSQLLSSAARSQLSLHVEERSGRRALTTLTHTQNRVGVHGLSPGHVYYFSLHLKHPSGASQTLGPIFIAKTRPNSPQNITVIDVTSSQIAVCWVAPDSTQNAVFEQYVLYWTDVSSGRVRGLWLNRGNLSAVISGLEAYHEYKITVRSITEEGVESSEATSLTVITEVSPPCSVSASAVGQNNMTVCWKPFQDDNIDGYRVQLLPHTSQARPREFWENSSDCLTLDMLVPEPEKVSDAIPYAVDTNCVVLFVQMPSSGLYDGLTVAYQRNRTWIPMSGGSSKVLVGDLRPGTLYKFQLFATSRGMSSDGFSMLPVRTCLAPPVCVRAGVVTDSSVEVLWDRAEGHGHSYEVLCLDCADSAMVQKVLQTRAVFKDVIPGKLCNISVRTEKESFSDSTAVFLTIRAFPAPPDDITFIEQDLNAMYITWTRPHGRVDGYKMRYGLAADIPLLHQVDVYSNNLRINDLTPGTDYKFEIQSFLGSDFSQSVNKNTSTRPAGLCSLILSHINSSSATLVWDTAAGQFDFHKVMVSNTSHNWTFNVSTHTQEYMLSGLRDGCSYNATVERANVSSVSPGTSYTVTVTAVASSGLSSPVSRIITTSESVPPAPSKPEGERVGSNGILLSWRMPLPPDPTIHSFIIRYKEVCPHPDPSFTEVTKSLDIPETLLNTLSPGATYNIQCRMCFICMCLSSAAAPGLVTNLTAYAQNHSTVLVTWFLPVRINGLITKFAVKAKHARTGQIVRTLELNAEDIMNGALPHCNDAADILSRGTPSPSESSLMTSAALPPVTLSAIPPASTWSVPISVRMDKLRPYTAYVFEVSAFTSDGEGQIASTMVRMPEAAPEDSPQNLSVWNITSKSLSLSWEPPTIITGRFSYVIQLYGPTGFINENNTSEQTFVYTGLTPYTPYRVSVMAKSAGATGPAAETRISTPPETPGAVSDLRAAAVDSTSVRLSWGVPSQPNGLITRYRIQVLYHEILVQDITLRRLQDANKTGESGGMLPESYYDSSSRVLRRYARSTNITTATAQSAITLASPSFQPTWSPSSPGSVSTGKLNTDTTNSLPAISRTAGIASQPLTPSPPATPPPWLTVTSDQRTSTPHESITVTTTDLSFVTSGSAHPPLPSSAQPQPSTRAAVTGVTYQPRPSTQTAITSWIEVLPPTEEAVDLSSDHISYVVRRLSPFTEYAFSVSAYTIIGEGPATVIREKTTEQVPSSVQDVSYQNISSTSVLVSWSPPLNPNGKITHYTIYLLNLHSHEAQQKLTNATSIVLIGLNKYTQYKLRVAASTAVGESPLSAEDDVYVLTPEDVPDSPPHDLAVVNTTSSTATIIWTPPDKPNGIIRQYEVSYGNATYHHVVNGTVPSITLRNLKPYTYYNVTVRAYTQLGHGDQTSETLQMLSGEDVPGSPPYGLGYESISSSEVNVSWSAPVVPNGLILYYIVEYWNATHTLNITTHSPFTLLTNLRKYAHYRLSVLAATRVGLGNHSSDVLNITTLEDGECACVFAVDKRQQKPQEQ
ncbi:hypothetical protein MHYP_G00122460 [Metynnis hypsauchen]